MNPPPNTSDETMSIDGATSPPNGNAFRVGDWIVEPAAHTLRRGATTVRLEPRVMAVLLDLAERPGRVVTRDELFERVWGGTFVNDEALSRAVSELRKALGDNPQRPGYVETIRKSGYRLVAAVEPIESVEAGTGRVRTADRQGRRRGWALGLTVGVTSIVVLLSIVQAMRTSSPASSDGDPAGGGHWASRPFTTFPGREIDPAISPDGGRVVFAWNEADDGEYDLYVKSVGGESTLRLTTAPGFEGHPVWSPDGTEVAFVRDGPDGAALFVVPAIGGAERRVTDLAAWSYGIDWSPDDRWIAISEPSPDGSAGITLIATDTAERTVVTRPDDRYRGDYKPVFAADSTTIAFIRAERVGVQDLYVVELGAELPPRRLTHQQRQVRGLDWTPDGRILLCWDLGGSFGLWRLDPTDGALDFVPIPGPHLFNPSISTGGRIVLEAVSYDRNVWRLDLPTTDPSASGEPLVHSTRQDEEAVWSPDGHRIAYVSDRTGTPQLWRAEADATDPLALTRSPGGAIGSLRWSPDASSIAYFSAPEGFAELNVVDAAGGPPRSLVSGRFHAVPQAWAADGAAIVYTSDRSGSWQLWRVSAEGGESTPVTQDGGLDAAVAPDGGLVFSRIGDTKLWRIDEPGDSAEPFGVEVPPSGQWRMAADGSVLATSPTTDEPVEVWRAADGRREPVATLFGFDASTFDLSPDGSTLLYGRLERADNDLVLVDPVDDDR